MKINTMVLNMLREIFRHDVVILNVVPKVQDHLIEVTIVRAVSLFISIYLLVLCFLRCSQVLSPCTWLYLLTTANKLGISMFTVITLSLCKLFFLRILPKNPIQNNLRQNLTIMIQLTLSISSEKLQFTKIIKKFAT